jgi:hypothetical protein
VTGRRQVRGRFRRRPLLGGVLTVGLVGAVAIFALQARPGANSPATVRLERGYVGTTYAFDGGVCLSAPRVAAEVLDVAVEQVPGSTTRLVRPPEGARPTLGFPAADDGADVAGYLVTPGGDDCTLRLLVTPSRTGTLRPGTVSVRLAYGPFGLLRRTARVRPAVTLDVTGEGADPRSSTNGG